MIRKSCILGRIMDHANTRALFDYWNGLRNGREAPYRSEIDPRRISGALETMFILEVLDAADIRFRLAGTGLCELVGMEPRGMVAGAVMEEGREAPLADLARQVVEEPGVGVMRVRGVPVANGRARSAARGEVLLLPMRSELGRLDRVLRPITLRFWNAPHPTGRSAARPSPCGCARWAPGCCRSSTTRRSRAAPRASPSARRRRRSSAAAGPTRRRSPRSTATRAPRARRRPRAATARRICGW